MLWTCGLRVRHVLKFVLEGELDRHVVSRTMEIRRIHGYKPFPCCRQMPLMVRTDSWWHFELAAMRGS